MKARDVAETLSSISEELRLVDLLKITRSWFEESDSSSIPDDVKGQFSEILMSGWRNYRDLIEENQMAARLCDSFYLDTLFDISNVRI